MTVINVTAGQRVVINGSIDLPQTSAIVLTTLSTSGTGAAITVNGTANVDGTLVLVLLDVPSGNTLVPVLEADAVNGSFSTITVQSPVTCATLTATQVVDSSGGLGALISVDYSTCNSGKKKKGLSNGAIAGIVLGVMAVLIIGGIVGGYFILTRCPQARFLFRSQRLRTRAQTYSHSITYDT